MRYYGLKRDEPDDRDLHFAATASSDDFVVPNAHDITGAFPPVMDQGMYGTCTAHATTAAYRYNMLNNDLADVPLSRAQLYWDSGVLEGNTGDVGRQIRDVVKSLATKGVAAESLWAYDKVGQMPTPDVYLDAVNQMAVEYARVAVSRADINTAIYMGHPVIIGVEIFPEFEGDEVAETGIVPMPAPGRTSSDAHCILLGAYDEQHDTFLNSWASWWGMPAKKGYGKFPRGYLEKYGSDFWTIFVNK